MRPKLITFCSQELELILPQDSPSMKKFWKTVEIKELENNTFQLLLDKNLLKTPLQNKLIFINYVS